MRKPVTEAEYIKLVDRWSTAEMNLHWVEGALKQAERRERKLRKLLAELEWINGDVGLDPTCPDCCEYQSDGHHETCKLARELKPLRKKGKR